MRIAFWVLAVGLSCLDWYAVWRADRRLESFAKPAAVLAIGVAAVASDLLDHPGGWLILIGLGFGLIGDVLLLDDGEPRFLGGLGAFLIGHLLYLAAFVQHGVEVTGWLFVVAVVLAGALVASRRVLPAARRDGGAGLAAAVTAYMVVLALFGLAAGATGRPLVALGAAVFLISDTVLAMNRFDRPIRHASLIVMVTYLSAQALIVGGWTLT